IGSAEAQKLCDATLATRPGYSRLGTPIATQLRRVRYRRVVIQCGGDEPGPDGVRVPGLPGARATARGASLGADRVRLPVARLRVRGRGRGSGDVPAGVAELRRVRRPGRTSIVAVSHRDQRL